MGGADLVASDYFAKMGIGGRPADFGPVGSELDGPFHLARLAHHQVDRHELEEVQGRVAGVDELAAGSFVDETGDAVVGAVEADGALDLWCFEVEGLWGGLGADWWGDGGPGDCEGGEDGEGESGNSVTVSWFMRHVHFPRFKNGSQLHASCCGATPTIFRSCL